MNSDDLTFLPLKVIRATPSGKRTFEPEGKRRLIEACQQPGVSISGMALKAGVNANQLRKWLLQSRKEASLACVTQAPAFVPVRQVDSPVPHHQQHTPMHASVLPSRLSARLPNGVTVELECTGHDTALVTAMITALGAH